MGKRRWKIFRGQELFDGKRKLEGKEVISLNFGGDYAILRRPFGQKFLRLNTCLKRKNSARKKGRN